MRNGLCADDVRSVVVPFPTAEKSAKSVLYVSNTGRADRPYFDPSVRYRCFNMAETGRAFGLQTYVATQAEVDAGQVPMHFDAYVFHRPKLTRELIKFIKSLPQGSGITADYDDLIFDVTATEHTSAVKSRNAPIWRVRHAISENMGALDLFERFTVSTVPLAEALSRLRPDAAVTVVPNVPDPAYLSLARQLRRKRSAVRMPRIGYFSGTNSHNEDLDHISEHLAEFCVQHDVEFFLMGPVEVPRALRRPFVKLKTSKVVSFHKMALEVSDCDLVIAPLAFSPFTQCKSAIKFMEAGVLGVPLVGTPIPDVARFISPLLFEASKPSDWGVALGKAWARDRTIDRKAGEELEALLISQRVPHFFD